MNRVGIFVAWLTLAAATTSSADEIGYIEDFALAKDRTVPLKQLIPGTEDYYYYHALHYQNTEQFDKVEEILNAWIKRYKYTDRVREIQNRQALLTYQQDPQKSLAFLRERLGLRFDHQRETLNKKLKLPTQLDPNRISRETLTKNALFRHKNLQGFEDAALDWLVATDLNADRRRHLLERLGRPDYPNLPKLVVDDLNYKYSKGFGVFGIHRQLLRTQLEECLKLKPDLLNQTHFVHTYLSKLHPNADVDWRHDPAEHEAYLQRLWGFVSRLDPVHNSLKAHVLYRRLAFDRSRGVYDKERFMTYIKLPRNVSYINPKYLELQENRKYRADLGANYQAQTLLPTIGNDEPLVRSYLHHFFVKETTYKPYEPYINDLYLKHNFAETKITGGLGDREQWYSMLPPAMYKQLQQRIDLDFAHTNKTLFAADEPVGLDLYVKNVKTLIVKVYEINTQNFYRENLREVDTAINLDGLVANEETTETYQEEPLRRVRRHFEFPSLKKPGTYVVDFIGNGKSSRVLVRKGTLRHLVRSTAAGHEFTVLDENNRKLTDATIWLAGHEYTPDKDGTITTPFSNRPGRQPIILSHGDFHRLDHFQHDAENYSLSAGIHVDREALLKRKKAQVVVRPGLYLNGTPVTLSVLEDVKLVLTSTDHDGVTTTKEVNDFKLFENRESVYEFQVPARLWKINFTLKAKVQNLSQNKKIDLAAGQTFSLNEIDRTEKIEDLHFLCAEGTYIVEVLGKTGEPKAGRPVAFVIKHRDFRDPVHVTLQTNQQGRIVLGRLQDVVWVRATGPQGAAHTWTPPRDEHTYHTVVHGKAGEPIELPYMGAAAEPLRSELSLLELRGNTFVADRFDAIAIKNGFLRIGDLPRGEYDLLLKQTGRRIKLRLTEGERREGYVLGENRQLEERGRKPLQIERIDVGKDVVTVHLQNASEFARVHVFATRYLPAYSAYGSLSRVRDPEPYLITVPKAETVYVAGRNIGDEYRYIIDRKYAKKFPSNMLKRPSLLLNPWPIRKTETSQQHAQAGDDFDRRGRESTTGKSGRPEAKQPPPKVRGDFANLDFLPYASAVLPNLRADDKGVVTIKRDALLQHQYIHVVAVDPQNTVYRSVSLAETESDFLDLRLAHGLDPKVHYSEQKQISVVPAKGKFVLSDITTSKFEAYDNLARVYGLFATLSGDAKLNEFGFILNWHKMKPKEKQAKYSKYACHELSFFLYKKDHEFFQRVVQPYLKNKRDKTFLDHWLIEDDLTDYLYPWAYSQLNIVERILLSQRIDGEPVHTSRHVRDLFNLIPPDIDRFNHLFLTALKGSALDTDDAFGLEKAAEKAARGLAGGRKKWASVDLRRNAGAGSAKTLAPPVGTPGPDAASNSPSHDEELAKVELEKQLDRTRAEAKELEVADEKKRSLERSRDAAKDYFKRLAEKRKSVRQLYRKLDKTQEWVENNYYHLAIEQQNGELIPVNSFWRDYAGHDPAEPFYSVNLAEASRNFPEMMFALAVLDIPFEAEKHDTEFAKTKMTLTAASPMIVFHREIKPAKAAADKTPILVSQNFFRQDDRYRQVNNEKLDKYVTDEFLVHTVYGCQVVVTNPTSSRQKLDVLLQVPVGAIPVLNGQYTRSVHIDLQPYHTQTIEYYFYFPAAGKYRHYPVHVAKNGALIANAEPFTLNVVNEPSRIDRESWDFVSQQGSNDDVLAFLNKENLGRVNLDRIAFRMADQKFFRTVVELLAQRHVYNQTLWSYGIKHNWVPAVREYLQHADSFVAACGSAVDSPLLTIDPVVRKTYQHMDYSPLVNARAHQLGKRRQILNNRFFAQYHRLLKVLSYRRELTDDDLMALTYYMLLQDRIDEALAFFGRVNAQNLQTRLQYDYFAAYLDLFTEEHKVARTIAEKWLVTLNRPDKQQLFFVAAGDVDERRSEYPVDRWRNAFAEVVRCLDEIEGKQIEPVDPDERTKTQTQLAATEPNFEFQVEAKKVHLNYQNLDEVRVNYYLMDVELLFSRNPFVEQSSGQFSHIRPNATETIKLPQKQTTHTFPLPDEFHTSNVLVEIIGGGRKKSQAYYSHALALQVIENYGQIRVTLGKNGKPAAKVYVKVYAQMQDGRVQFYKDGYTDLRGRFDYTSLNTNELDFVRKFSLLVLSEEHGAVVQEVNPPKR